MFECTLEQGELFRRIVVALSDLVTEGNFMIDPAHISFQGMDSSHVSLCALSLRKEGFQDYRCDRDVTLGLNFDSLLKVLKCMGSKDALSIRHEEDTDVALFVFEATTEARISNFELKLMEIDAEQLGIPVTSYSATVKMPSSEFQRICKDLSAIGDSVTIEVSKEGVQFSVTGAIGTGCMSLKGRMLTKVKKVKQKREPQSNETPGGEEADDEDEDQDEDADSIQPHVVKDEPVDHAYDENGNRVVVQNSNNENGNDMDDDEDDDLDMAGAELNAISVNVDEPANDGNNEHADEQNESGNGNGSDENGNNADENGEAESDIDTGSDDDEEDDEEESEYEFEDIHNTGNIDDDPEKLVLIQMSEPVRQQFACRYLNNFTKATNLSKMVVLQLGPEVPLVVEYKIGDIGDIRYYLAPKIDDED